MRFKCSLLILLFIIFNNIANADSIQTLPISVQQEMLHNTWHAGCPVLFDQLSYVTVNYWGFDQHAHEGILLVNQKIAPQVLKIFQQLYQHKFPIERMRPMYFYHGNDNLAMSENNTSAFNCRLMTGHATKFSRHSYGMAIDINPRINPYIRKGKILPTNAIPYAQQSKQQPGTIIKNGFVYNLFVRDGWKWGGNWRYIKDYGHFEK